MILDRIAPDAIPSRKRAMRTESERENGAFDRERWRTRRFAHRLRGEKQSARAISVAMARDSDAERESMRLAMAIRARAHGGTTSSQLISVNSPENKKDLFCDPTKRQTNRLSKRKKRNKIGYLRLTPKTKTSWPSGPLKQ